MPWLLALSPPQQTASHTPFMEITCVEESYIHRGSSRTTTSWPNDRPGLILSERVVRLVLQSQRRGNRHPCPTYLFTVRSLPRITTAATPQPYVHLTARHYRSSHLARGLGVVSCHLQAALSFLRRTNTRLNLLKQSFRRAISLQSPGLPQLINGSN
jgi:hypothetical protein